MASAMNTPISIIIPVYNEAAAINQTLRHLAKSLAGIQPEVIVVDGNPLGNTLASIDPHFYSKKIILKTKISKRSGRAVQMNTGSELAKGNVLLFLHADTILPIQAAGSMLQQLKDPSLACGAFSLGIRHHKKAYRLIEFMANHKSKITRLPYGDQAQFFRKDYFESLGGFADIPLMEDVEIMQRVKKRKDRCKILQEKVFTSARRWEKEGILYCTLRNWTLISLYVLGVSPHLLAKYYA
jgi:rSAM/selenodomain-associated transferase 2